MLTTHQHGTSQNSLFCALRTPHLATVRSQNCPPFTGTPRARSSSSRASREGGNRYICLNPGVMGHDLGKDSRPEDLPPFSDFKLLGPLTWTAGTSPA